jgi:hypothetical protein
MKVIVRAFSEGKLAKEALLAAIAATLDKTLTRRRNNEEPDGPNYTYKDRQILGPGSSPTRGYVEVNVSDF